MTRRIRAAGFGMVVLLGGALPYSRGEAQAFQPSFVQPEATANASTATDYLRVFAEGNIRGLASGSDAQATGDIQTAATGSLGLRIQKSTTIWTASISIASTVDTLRDAFGESLLLPGTGSGLVSGIVQVRGKDRSLHFFQFPKNVGAYLYGSSSKSVWSRNLDSSGTTVTDSSAVTVVGVGAGLFYDVAAAKIGDTPVGLTLEAGVALRSIGGDIALPRHASLRQSVIGNPDEQVFWGVEGGPQVTFGNVTGALRLFFFPHNNTVGFSRAQVTAGFSVQGSILEGKF